MNSLPESYIVFDFETTGLDCDKCEVVQISAIKFQEGEKTLFNRFVKVSCKIDPGAAEVHGITDEILATEGVDPESAWKDFAAFIEGNDLLIGHNIVGFDCGFLDKFFNIYELELPDQSRYFDTAMIYKAKKMGERRRDDESLYDFFKRISSIRARGVYYKLTLICDELGINREEFTAHRADGDVEMTNLILIDFFR